MIYYYIIHFIIELDAKLHQGRGSVWKATTAMVVLQVWALCSIDAWIKIFFGRLFLLNSPIVFILSITLTLAVGNGYLIDKNQNKYSREFSKWPQAKRASWNYYAVGLILFIFAFNLYSAARAR